MTTDPFTTADDRWDESPHHLADHCEHAGVGKACRRCRRKFDASAQWARTYLAEQEPSEEEVEDAYEAFISHNGPARELNEFRERCCVECGDAVSWPGKKPDGGKRDRLHGMRAALIAARAVGRDAR